MAGTLLLVLPMIILFAVFQKHFIRGIAVQGRKG
jgi:ABC-type glycerol-3-phosphate transport system permease component